VTISPCSTPLNSHSAPHSGQVTFIAIPPFLVGYRLSAISYQLLP
jgi:hypothetical protein